MCMRISWLFRGGLGLEALEVSRYHHNEYWKHLRCTDLSHNLSVGLCT
jgi:hypothetical protein